MIYAVSDIHGCYEKYVQLLEIIRFSEGDTLYVLGDVVDRGSGGIRVLQHMKEHGNILPLRGNHEVLAASLLPRRVCTAGSLWSSVSCGFRTAGGRLMKRLPL